jgi:hypothetical protein
VRAVDTVIILYNTMQLMRKLHNYACIVSTMLF